jgi:hypothetical protein
MLQLLCHPKTPADFVESVDVAVTLSASGALWLRYHVEVPEPELEIGGPKSPDRTDGLWQTTCFEAFLAIGDDPQYIELNFAPSSRWAAYQFDDIREGMKPLNLASDPEVHLDMSRGHVAIEAELQLPTNWQSGRFSIGLAAVLEEPSGKKSYWALDHHKPEPDFHDRSCFTLQLEAGGKT